MDTTGSGQFSKTVGVKERLGVCYKGQHEITWSNNAVPRFACLSYFRCQLTALVEVNSPQPDRHEQYKEHRNRH